MFDFKLLSYRVRTILSIPILSELPTFRRMTEVIVQTPCGHIFHKRCLGGWMQAPKHLEWASKPDKNKRAPSSSSGFDHLKISFFFLFRYVSPKKIEVGNINHFK
jgi:hypothetical protein